ncbi:DUF5776 domain-containing protein [Levilactobacillus brevis]|uniref:DUF5776 domain-containing protein n=1 Tax=Levilactobacillus brevis TaxID=1580 RepID=UPI0025A0214D|nr:DUF5776 domain-containing protein [Levilactobacillus brevis]MDM7551996.1 DUF5776 domain-containing protein [Levilactobacillus brevis]MDM7648743.1 DUF5776 domain-containing protein [Levilactobacillus brevis]
MSVLTTYTGTGTYYNADGSDTNTTVSGTSGTLGEVRINLNQRTAYVWDSMLNATSNTSAKLYRKITSVSNFMYLSSAYTTKSLTINFVDTDGNSIDDSMTFDFPDNSDKLENALLDATPTVDGYTLNSAAVTTGSDDNPAVTYTFTKNSSDSGSGSDSSSSESSSSESSSSESSSSESSSSESSSSESSSSESSSSESSSSESSSSESSNSESSSSESSSSESSSVNSATSSTDSGNFSDSSSANGAGDTATSSVTKVSVSKASVYAIRKIGLYKKVNFTKNNRIRWYQKQPRTKRPKFTVIGYARTKAGTLRYKVKTTSGQTGYITANTDYVGNTYYQTTPKKITVINAKGINAYRKVNLTSKVRHYRKGTVLKVKAVKQHGITTRLILTNGTYITANKTMVLKK